MATEIDSVACDIINGDVLPLMTRTRTWEQPGIDGSGAQTVGEGKGGFSLELIKYGNTAAIVAWIKAIAAIQGKEGDVTNSRGVTHSDLFFEDVRLVERKEALHEGGEMARVLVRGVRLTNDGSWG